MSIFARVTLPLAAVNFLNQASRVMVATLGPLLAVEFGLSASELGLLAAVFFATYGLAQLPVGLALDLHGARRVQAALALVATLGFLLCAVAQDPWLLGLGRAVTGAGVSAGLMAMLKANTQWYPLDRVAAVTGAGVFIGALGGLSATVPVQWLLPLLGWRGAFLVLALLGAAVAAWIWLSVPDRPPGARAPARRGLGREIAEFGRIFAHPAFVRLVPAICLLSGLNFTWQGLWSGPWLRDVAGLGEAARAQVLLCYALGMAIGSLLTGQWASALQRRGFDPMAVPWAGMALQAAVLAALLLRPEGFGWSALLWFLFAFAGASGPAGYAAVGQRFGAELAGRVATAINASMLALVFVLQNAIGWILDLWPRTEAGGWDPAGYGWAIGVTLLLQAASVGWMLVLPRR